MSDFTISVKAARFDDGDAKQQQLLEQQFATVDPASLVSIRLSENSYGTQACQWISDNILKRARNLQKADFSDMFTARLRSDLPNSLRVLMEGIST